MRVLITGAIGGLGRAMAVECARRGYELFLTDMSQELLDILKAGLQRLYPGVKIDSKACDLTDAASVDALLAYTDAQNIRFDMLLNIAGMGSEGRFMEHDRERMVKLVTVNNAATLRITHALLHRRVEDSPFSIVFVSSLASMFPMPLKATYASSKRFLYDFGTALHYELKDENVNVLVICPGGMVTTEQIATAIAAQGVAGILSTNPLEQVARKSIDMALKGKACYVPGALNQSLTVLGKLAPRSVVAQVVRWRWSNTQKKWLNKK